MRKALTAVVLLFLTSQVACVRKSAPASSPAGASPQPAGGVTTDNALKGYETDPRNRRDYSYEEAWEQREHCRTQCCH